MQAIVFTVIICSVIAVTVPLVLALNFAVEKYDWFDLHQTIFSTQIHLSNVIIESSVAVSVALLVLLYERKRQKDPLKRALKSKLERLENQRSASRNGIIHLDNRKYLHVYLRGLERLSLLVLQFYGADEFEMFSQQIERSIEALDKDIDYSMQVMDTTTDYLSDLIRRY